MCTLIWAHKPINIFSSGPTRVTRSGPPHSSAQGLSAVSEGAKRARPEHGELATTMASQDTEQARLVGGELAQSRMLKFLDKLAHGRRAQTKILTSSSSARHVHLVRQLKYLCCFMIVRWDS